ncbi:MAG: imidazoleglycerol-phosphate dehydratase HisB [Nitrospinota bacterium]
MVKKAEVNRKTLETEFRVKLRLQGRGKYLISTGIGFLDHMLSQMAKHGRMDLSLSGKGDLEVDAHHSVEDVGLSLGRAIREALGKRQGIRRFGSARVPMMDALAEVALDLGGRSNLNFRAEFAPAPLGDMEPELIREFFWALSSEAGMDLHIEVPYGSSGHHMAEAIFKAFGLAIKQASSKEPGRKDIPSTKGAL